MPEDPRDYYGHWSSAHLALKARTLERNELLAICKQVLAELEERNAEEGMALTLSEKAEWLTPGFRAMVAAVKKYTV